PNVTGMRPTLPLAIDRVVTTAMAKRAEDRYPTAGDLAGAAAEALGVQPVTPTTPTRPVPLRLRRLSRGALAAIGAGVVAVIVLVVALLIANGGGKPAGPSAPGGAALMDYVARVDHSTRQVGAKMQAGEAPIDVAGGEG